MLSERKKVYFKKGFSSALTLAVGGALAGFCNGLLGAGGGIVLVFFLSRVVGEDEEERRSVYANALCIMLPLSVLTLSRYGGPVGIEKMVIDPSFVLGAVAGGVLGGFALGKARGSFSDKLFAILTLTSGILMIMR